MDLAICFTSQEGLFDAQGLTRGFGGGLRPAAGCTGKSKKFEKQTN